jgi:hypothetical protein
MFPVPMPQMPAYNAHWHGWHNGNQAAQQTPENLPQDDLFGPIMYAPMAQPQPGVINLNDEVPLAHIQMHGPAPAPAPISMQLMPAPAPMHMQDVRGVVDWA